MKNPIAQGLAFLRWSKLNAIQRAQQTAGARAAKALKRKKKLTA